MLSAPIPPFFHEFNPKMHDFHPPFTPSEHAKYVPENIHDRFNHFMDVSESNAKKSPSPVEYLPWIILTKGVEEEYKRKNASLPLGKDFDPEPIYENHHKMDAFGFFH